MCVAGGGRCIAPTNSMATADGTLLELHWWTARVSLNLVYPSSSEFTRSPGGTRRMNTVTDKCACGLPYAQEHHCQARQCVQKSRCDGPPGFRPMAWDMYVSVMLVHFCSCWGHQQEERTAAIARSCLSHNSNGEGRTLNNWKQQNCVTYAMQYSGCTSPAAYYSFKYNATLCIMECGILS